MGYFELECWHCGKLIGYQQDAKILDGKTYCIKKRCQKAGRIKRLGTLR